MTGGPLPGPGEVHFIGGLSRWGAGDEAVGRCLPYGTMTAFDLRWAVPPYDGADDGVLIF